MAKPYDQLTLQELIALRASMMENHAKLLRSKKTTFEGAAKALFKKIFEEIAEYKSVPIVLNQVVAYEPLYNKYFNTGDFLNDTSPIAVYNNLIKLYNEIIKQLDKDIAAKQPKPEQPIAKEQAKAEADELFKLKRPLTAEEKARAYYLINQFHRLLSLPLRQYY